MEEYESIVICYENSNIEKFLINELSKLNIQLNKFEYLGIKKLAYSTHNERYGKYYMLDITCSSYWLEKLEKLYKKRNEILKFIIIRKED